MHLATLPALLSFAWIALASLEERAVANPTAVISQGTVIGTATRVQNQPSVTGLVNAYLGVPFAAKPVRFAPPQKAPAFSAPFVANKLPPICLEQTAKTATGNLTNFYFENPVGNPPLAEAEDCLYLNVYAPRNASSSNTKAVLFWVFGGNLAGGGSSLNAYNGSSLAVTQDVVVVVPNYRTNIFGFSNSPEIPVGQQNSGFLDQRFALQWVQNNIAKFGGDPAKVTIFGQSAGGFSVKQLLAQPPDPLPFRAAIVQAEAQLGSNGAASYQAVVDHFNCSTAASPIECLRSPRISGVDIQNFIESQTNLSFPPVLDSTNMNDNTKPSIDSGKFAQVPILIGNNNDETTVFLEIAGVTPSNPIPLNQTLGALLGVDISNVTNALAALYAPIVGNSTYDILQRILTDYIFTCPNRIISQAIASGNRQPIWRYRYDASFPNVLYNKPYLGAYHTEEIFHAWGTYPTTNQYGSVTPTQRALSSYMQGVWANFAKNPSAGPGWPQITSSTNGVELGVLGGQNNTSGEDTIPKLDADYACAAILDALIIAGGGGY